MSPAPFIARARLLLPPAALFTALGYGVACHGSAGTTTSGTAGSTSASSSSGMAGASSASTSSSTSASSSASTSSSSGGPDAGTLSKFTPEGCGFSIAPRPEYIGFQDGTTTVGATPNIRRVRLGLGGNVAVGASGRADPSTTIAMAWQTDEGTLASEVQWGTGTDPTKWPAANLATGVTWDTPGSLGASPERMHEVYVCGLQPSTTYSYRVGGGPAGQEAWSDVYTFTTTPAAGPTSVKILVNGDSRSEIANAWQILEQRAMTAGVALQLFSGDVINLATDQSEWEQWVDNAWKDGNGNTSALGQILMLVAHGNHENHTTLYYGNLVQPQDLASYPQYTELFYSVDVGPLHIVSFDDSYIVDPTGDPAFEGIFKDWLTKDLTAANQNRANVPWVVTMHHHSAYSSSLHGTDADVLMGRQSIVPIWKQFHVDVDFGGHDHDFERTQPLDPGTDPNNPTVTTPDQGTVYVVCGGSGAPAYGAGTSSWTAVSKDTTNGGGIGFYTIVTADAHNLTLDSHELEADASDPLVESPAFTITK